MKKLSPWGQPGAIGERRVCTTARDTESRSTDGARSGRRVSAWKGSRIKKGRTAGQTNVGSVGSRGSERPVRNTLPSDLIGVRWVERPTARGKKRSPTGPGFHRTEVHQPYSGAGRGTFSLSRTVAHDCPRKVCCTPPQRGACGR